MLTKWKERARRGAAVVALAGALGVGAAAVTVTVDIVTASSASADPVDVGDNTSCSPGTDHCSGWLPSQHIACMVYNVLWDHVWVNTPGGEAWWKVTVDRYWTCNGPASFIATVGLFYELDTVVPWNHLTGLNKGTGEVWFLAADWSGLNGGYTSNVHQWTLCGGTSGGRDPHSYGVYVSAASAPFLTFLAGNQTYNSTCVSNGILTNGQYGTNGVETRQTTPSSAWSYDGSYARWGHANLTDSLGGQHPYQWLNLW